MVHMSKFRGSMFVILSLSVNAFGARTFIESKFPKSCSTMSDSGLSRLQTGISAVGRPTADEQAVLRRSREALRALKSRNMKELSTMVHPEKGLRFSPYNEVLVGKNEDRDFTRAQVANLLTNRRKYIWGAFDGSGDPIRFTFPAYYRRFIYDYDFSKVTPTISRSSEVTGAGNSVNNLAEVYPGTIVARFHFEGLKDKYEGMNWKTLWLVFEKKGAEWFLVGIVHGEWTI
jgi:hypothetical protein